MNTLINIFSMRCPRCHEGNLFKTNYYFRFRNFLSMDSHCAYCNLRFEREPGFFFGAMYISYAFNVAMFIALIIANSLFFNIENTYIFIAIYILMIALNFPLIFRISRSIWIHIFIRFDSNNRNEF
jgi:uncharacterized protein (DUF983 family)